MIKIYKLKIFVLLFGALMMSQIAKASHAVAGNITYTCLGGNTYRVTLSFYRDCAGIAAGSTVQINVNSVSCGQSLVVNCNLRAGSGQDVTPSCPGVLNTCNGGVIKGIQEYIYEGIITLPMQCADWEFSWLNCCRNSAITTVPSPSTKTLYIYSTLNNLTAPCNNSPVFTNRPVPFICRTQQFCFNNGAYDVDGDSLVYQMINPLQNAGVQVPYNASYSASQPLHSTPLITIDPATGDVCMTPQALEVTVMAVQVSEYRNGVLIGSVERDLQITVINCADNLPSASGFNGTASYSATVCANSPNCFTINSLDVDTAQHVTMTWNNTIPGATFNTTASKNPVGTFCWTPSSANIGHHYTFTVKVVDDACPYMGTQVFSYNLTVTGIAVNAGADQQVTCLGTASLTANASIGAGPYTYSWNTGETTQTINAGVGTYIVTATNGTCSAKDTVNVTLVSSGAAAFTPSVPYCYQSPVSFNDQSTGTILGWQWNFGDGSTSTSQNPSHQFATAGTYTVKLVIQTGSGCSDTVIHTLNFNPIPVAAFSASAACIGNATCFTNTTTGTNGWQWNFGDNAYSIAQNPCHTYASAGTYSVKLVAGDSTSCPDSVMHVITINALPSFNITGNNVCVGSSTSFTANIASGNISTYSWNLGNSTTSASANPSLTYAAGTYSVSLTGTSSSGCTSAATATITVFALPVVNAGADQSICKGNSASLNASSGYSYLWTPGNCTTQSFNVNPTNTTNYIVKATDANGCMNQDTVQVIVHSLPVINAGVDKTICSGATTSISASGAISYSWAPGNMTSTSVSVSPTSNATYYVTGTDVNGCQSGDTVSVNVNALPVMVLVPKAICPGASTTLDAGNAGSTYSWNTGATSQTITATDSGNYSVTITNVNGCSATGNVQVTLLNSTTANPTNVSVCMGQTAVLDAGIPGCTYSWSIGATSQSIFTDIAGVYYVTVTNSFGCSITFADSVIVHSLPVINAGTDKSVCTGSTISISATGASSYSWVPGNMSAQGISISPTANTTYYAYGTDVNGCQSNDTVNVSVNSLPVVSLSPVTMCAGTTTTLNVGNAGSTFSWNTGATTQTILVPDSGNYSVQVTNSNNCSATGSVHINLAPSTVLNPITTSICQGLSATLNAGNPGSTYSWSTGATTQTITAATAGVYTVSLTTSYGCVATFSDTVNVNPLPSVNFSATSPCIGNANSFTNLSSISSGSITSYSWSFGDAFSSTNSNPNHTYAIPGTYNVTLTATSSNGCTATASIPATIHPKPVALFTTNTVCLNQSSSFNDLSSIINGTISSWTWKYGDNSTSTSSSSSASPHIYTNPGTYSVRLTVTSQFGCVDSTTQTVRVNGLPNASFSVSNVCQNSTLSILNNSSSSYGSISSYNWNFGNGSTSSSSNPNYSYPTSGPQTIKLVITSSLGCTDTITKTAQIYPSPVADFNPTNVCENKAVPFSNISSVSSGNISSFAWTFGDGSTSSITSPSHSYSTSNSYSVRLIATSNYGCRDTAIKTVTTYPVPVATFKTTDACLNSPVTFFDSSSIKSGSISTWAWTFGDGSSSAFENPSHQYTTAGTYNVKLTVTSANGCSATANASAVANAVPKASFISTEPCFGTPVQFTNQSTIQNGVTVSNDWDFGFVHQNAPGNTSYNFGSAGKFPVTLTVTSSKGCADSVTNPAVVHDFPVAGFSAGGQCFGKPTSFNDESMSSDGSITHWSWEFGDTSSSLIPSPVHQYNSDNDYNVKLTVTNSYGCTSNIVQQVSVNPNPAVVFSGGGAGCALFNAHFKDSSYIHKGAIVGWLWDFGDGSVSTDQQPQHDYLKSGTYPVTLTVESDRGCYTSKTKPGLVYAYPSPYADLIMDQTKANSMNPVFHFTNTSQDYISYQWNFGDGTTESNILNPAHTYRDTGKYTAQLVVTNSFGCRDTVLQILEIDAKSQMLIPNAFTPNDDGTNDVFKPVFAQMREIEVQIYNRWGELLKSWSGLNGSWDGKYKGQPVQSDTYVYQIKGVGEDNKNYEWTGSVTVAK